MGVYLNHLKGKIINHNDSFFGEVKFEERISNIDRINDLDSDNYIIPGFVDLHCHGGGGHDTMAGLSDIKKNVQISFDKWYYNNFTNNIDRFIR